MADMSGVENSRTERAARSASAASRRDPATNEQDRAAFLIEASRTLAASLDYERALTTIAAMSGSHLDAWVIVALTAIEGKTKKRFAYGVDSIDQSLNPELFGLDSTFLVLHGVTQKTSGDALFERGI